MKPASSQLKQFTIIATAILLVVLAVVFWAPPMVCRAFLVALATVTMFATLWNLLTPKP